MKSLQTLQAELRDAERELDSISIQKYTKPNYDYERGEVYGESQGYKEFTDPYRAHQLIREIAKLKDLVYNYATYAKQERENIEFQHQMQQQAEQDYLDKSAHKLYEAALAEYHSKSFIGKISAIFSGKKPKKNMSDKEIQSTYGTEAKYLLDKEGIEAKIAELEAAKAQEIDWYTNHSQNPNAENLMNAQIYMYDKQIEELQSRLEELSAGRGK